MICLVFVGILGWPDVPSLSTARNRGRRVGSEPGPAGGVGGPVWRPVED